MNKNKKTLKNTETYREIILVCDYCGKKQPNNNNVKHKQGFRNPLQA